MSACVNFSRDLECKTLIVAWCMAMLCDESLFVPACMFLLVPIPAPCGWQYYLYSGYVWVDRECMQWFSCWYVIEKVLASCITIACRLELVSLCSN